MRHNFRERYGDGRTRAPSSGAKVAGSEERRSVVRISGGRNGRASSAGWRENISRDGTECTCTGRNCRHETIFGARGTERTDSLDYGICDAAEENISGARRARGSNGISKDTERAARMEGGSGAIPADN